MSLYQLQKFLYELNRDESVKEKFHSDLEALISQFDLMKKKATLYEKVI